MLNRTTLTGHTTKNIDLKYTQSGKAVASFVLAVNRGFKNDNGEREADFIRCVIWGKSAENFANYVHKGDLIGVDGRIQTRNYDDRDGKKVYITEVVVEIFSFLKSHNDQRSNGDFNQSQQNNYNNASKHQPRKENPFNSNPNTIDVPDQDLPF